MKERSYSLHSIVLSKGDKTVDIRELMENAVLFEDIFSNTMSGTLTINDALGLVEDFPIVGNEFLTFKFKSNLVDSYFEKTFRVRSISNIIPSSTTRSRAYQLKLVSDLFVRDYNVRLQRSYHGKVSDIVSEIVGNLGYEMAEVEATKSKIDFVVPNWSPLQTINRLLDIAIAESGSASFLFFEDQDGFRFVTIDKLTQNKTDIVLSNSILNYDTRIINPLNVSSFQVVTAFDNANESSIGMLGNRAVTYDIINKKIKSMSLRYSDYFSEINPVESSPSVEEPESTTSNQVYIKSSNYLNEPSGYVSIRRLPRYAHFERYKLIADIQSWTGLRVGSVVDFDIESPRIGSQSSDKYLKGKYLVTKIKHSLTIESHLMTLDLRRDSIRG